MEHVSDLYLDGPCGLQADLGFFRGPDGRPYRVLALHCNQTYAFSSLLYGIPRPEQNEETLAAIREYCAKLGPPPNDTHPIHFERPPLIHMAHPNPALEDTGERLPRYFVVVDVESNGIAADGDCDFSSLRCVYFLDRFAPVTLMEEIERRTVALPWEDLAHAWDPLVHLPQAALLRSQPRHVLCRTHEPTGRKAAGVDLRRIGTVSRPERLCTAAARGSGVITQAREGSHKRCLASWA